MRCGALVAGAVAVVAVGACGLGSHAPKEELPEFSAARLGDLSAQDSILDLLDPEEREAMERTGMSGARPEHQAAIEEATETTGDKVGKASISILSVALSAAAAAAPFFLF